MGRRSVSFSNAARCIKTIRAPQVVAELAVLHRKGRLKQLSGIWTLTPHCTGRVYDFKLDINLLQDMKGRAILHSALTSHGTAV
jgi:hypothetical protein